MYYSIKEIITKIGIRKKLLYNAVHASKEFGLGNKFIIYYCLNRNKYKNQLKNLIREILEKYDAEYVEDITLTSVKLKKREYKIWVMWWQGREYMPDIIKLCYRRMRNYAKRYELIFISKENIDQYILIPEVIKEKHKMGIIGEAHFADYIRVALLKEYGGLWIDASIYCMHEIENIEDLRLLTGKNVGRCKWTTFLLGTNETNNKLFLLLKYYFEKYWENQNISIDYFFFDFFIEYLYENHMDIKEMIDSVENNITDIYSLLSLLSEPYDEIIFSSIAKTHTFQKLSQKKDYKMYKNGLETFAKVLLKESEN